MMEGHLEELDARYSSRLYTSLVTWLSIDDIPSAPSPHDILAFVVHCIIRSSGLRYPAKRAALPVPTSAAVVPGFAPPIRAQPPVTPITGWVGAQDAGTTYATEDGSRIVTITARAVGVALVVSASCATQDEGASASSLVSREPLPLEVARYVRGCAAETGPASSRAERRRAVLRCAEPLREDSISESLQTAVTALVGLSEGPRAALPPTASSAAPSGRAPQETAAAPLRDDGGGIHAGVGAASAAAPSHALPAYNYDPAGEPRRLGGGGGHMPSRVWPDRDPAGDFADDLGPAVMPGVIGGGFGGAWGAPALMPGGFARRGGMLVGPDHPVFGGPRGGFDDGCTPPGVPPGARFDPYGPPLPPPRRGGGAVGGRWPRGIMPPQPRGGSGVIGGEPQPDHLIPPNSDGGNDDGPPAGMYE